jgi:hypothetical protein
MNSLKHLIGFFSAALLISSCKKENDFPENLPVNNDLEIRLDTSYVPFSKIDSALVIWEVAGQVQQHKLKLSGDTLRFPVHQLIVGKGRMTLQLYTQVKHRGEYLQFEKRWNAHVSKQNSIIAAGPAGFNDGDWLPRVILKEKDWSGTVLIAAIRPNDPYFSIRNISPRWPLLGLVRAYYKKLGGQPLAEKVWTVDATGRLEIEDRTFFLSLGEQLANQAWTWVDINLDIVSRVENVMPSLQFSSPR